MKLHEWGESNPICAAEGKNFVSCPSVLKYNRKPNKPWLPSFGTKKDAENLLPRHVLALGGCMVDRMKQGVKLTYIGHQGWSLRFHFRVVV